MNQRSVGFTMIVIGLPVVILSYASGDEGLRVLIRIIGGTIAMIGGCLVFASGQNNPRR